jgi:hypothetical protein
MHVLEIVVMKLESIPNHVKIVGLILNIEIAWNLARRTPFSWSHEIIPVSSIC